MKTKDLAYIALFAAITAVLGLLPAIPVPAVPVPITAQTLGVMLAGAVLGARRGFLALLLFLVLVAVGLPVLAGGRGGLAVFAARAPASFSPGRSARSSPACSPRRSGGASTWPGPSWPRWSAGSP